MSAHEQLGFQFDGADPAPPPKERPIPKAAHLPGVGKVRVLSYAGNDRFHVLDRTDTQRFVHRDRLTFLKG